MSNVVCRLIVVLVGILCFSNVAVFAESLEECLARWDRVLKNCLLGADAEYDKIVDNLNPDSPDFLEKLEAANDERDGNRDNCYSSCEKGKKNCE